MRTPALLVGSVMACSSAPTPPPLVAAPQATATVAAPPAPTPAAARKPPPPPAPARIRFPALVTKDLNGDVQRIPDGLPGELKLFLVAYRQRQQLDIDPWLTLGLRLEGVHAGFRVYELPTLARSWGLVSGWVDDGMRGGIRDPEARARTLTLYIDKEPFNAALELPTEDQVYALLVDASGGVVWQAAGRPDDASSAALTAEVERRLATR